MQYEIAGQLFEQTNADFWWKHKLPKLNTVVATFLA